MICTPAQALRQRSVESLAMICLLALAFALPGLVATASWSARDAAARWLNDYRPIVYLRADADATQRDALTRELEATSGVGSVQARTPAQALAQLGERLGDEQVRHLGLNASMLPHSLIVEPLVPVHGHLQLASALGSLEARAHVEAVDLPAPAALQTLELARRLMTLALLTMLGLLSVSFTLLIALLRRLQQDERQEHALLEVFGASATSLARPTLTRGALIGCWAGGAAALMSLLAQWSLQGAAQGMGYVSIFGPVSWLVVAAPLALAPLCGALAGLFALRVRARKRPALAQTRAALRYAI